MRALILAAAIFATLFVLQSSVFAASAKVLLLHSNSKNSAQAVATGLGMQAILTKNSSTTLFRSYLGIDVDDDEERLDSKAERLRNRFPRGTLSAVVCDGDGALAFAAKYRSLLFAGVPLVACNLTEAPSYRPKAPFTALIASLDWKPVLQTLLEQYPTTTLVMVLTGNDDQAKAMRTSMERAAKSYLNRIQIMYPGFEAGDEGSISKERLLEYVRNAPKDSLILYGGFTGGQNGSPVYDRVLVAAIVEQSSVPVHTLLAHAAPPMKSTIPWSYKQHGAVAADLVTAILDNPNAALPADRVLTNKRAPGFFTESSLTSEPAKPKAAPALDASSRTTKKGIAIPQALIIGLIAGAGFLVVLLVFRQRSDKKE